MKVKLKKTLCLILTLVMILSLMPGTVGASGGTTYTKISSASEITDGNYVIYGKNTSQNTNGALGNSLSFSKVAAIDVTESNGVITSPDEKAIWTITKVDGGYTLYNASAKKYLNITVDDTAGFALQDNAAVFTAADSSKNSGIDVVATNSAANGRGIGLYKTDFRCYKPAKAYELYLYKEGTATQCATPTANPAAGAVVAGTQVTFACSTEGAALSYRIKDSGSEFASVTGPVTITEAVTYEVKATKEGLTESTKEFAYTILTEQDIATVRGAEENDKVMTKGVVTLIDSQTVYIQDATAGIAVNYQNKNNVPSTLKVGMELSVTGTIGFYNNLKQINLATPATDAVVGEMKTVPAAAELTFAQLVTEGTAAVYEAKLVSVDNVEIGEVNTGGTTYIYAPGDTSGDKFAVYKITLPENVYEGCTVNLTAVMSRYRDNFQLRVTDVEVVKGGIAAPVITLSAEAVEAGKSADVTIECATEDAEIYYTIDGSEPTADKTKYTEKFSVTPTAEAPVTIKAIAVKEGLVNSPVAEESCKVKVTTPASHVVINQAYGGGGNNSAPYKNDFVELYNPTAEAVSLKGWSLQYAKESVAFADGATYPFSDTAEIAAGGYFLIKLGGGSTGEELPTADASYSSINAVASNFKFALSKSTAAITGLEDESLIDLVAAGTGTPYEGTGAVTGAGNTKAVIRNTDGVDTDDNAADFIAAAPNPRNSATTPNPPAGSEYDTIAEALAGEKDAEFTVKGVVTMIEAGDDTYSVYIQDATGGICARIAKADAEGKISLGDTLIVSGKRDTYNQLPQLAGATFEASTGLILEAKPTTIAGLTTADVCCYISLNEVEVTEVYDDNGAYSNPNITVKDATGKTIRLYKAVVGKTNGAWDVKVGDYVNITAAVGNNKGTLQLRNTLATEVEKLESYDTDKDVTDTIAAWGGGLYTEGFEEKLIYGDKYVSRDSADTTAEFTVVAKGVQAAAFTGGSGDKYMGGYGLGSANGDYAQFKVNAAGWGDMELSFRLRASGGAAGELQLCYSTDGGTTFQNFVGGSYEYAYTQYTSDSSYPVSGSGSITDGVAKTTLAVAQYIEFTFAVPMGAENCNNLIIRLVPNGKTANGGEGIGGTSNIRIDSVVLSGSPIVDDNIVGYVSVVPDGVDEDQPAGTELTMSSATEGATILYRFNGEGEFLTYDAGAKPVLPQTLPANLEVKATKADLQGSVTRILTYAAGTVESVKVTPNGGGVYISGDSTEVKLECKTEGATIYYMTSGDGATWPENWSVYSAPITLAKDFDSYHIKAYAAKEGFNSSAVITRDFTEMDSEKYNIYFGQLHSHTNISDGSGEIEDAYAHADGVYSMDFLAVTDHSNSFDNADSGVISENGTAVSTEWARAKAAATAATDEQFVGLYGYEMTWSNGLGHINTFNTPGWQSRTQSAYSSYGTALQNYYAALKTVPQSLSQFNHPGTTFGDFSDFAHYDEELDSLITLIEVGNGEGAIGSSGYFPSYEYYTRALDKGWHVAPTNNQDNHKGNWGDSNTARSVVLATDLSENAIYDAMRNYRVYATEDNDLSIYYTMDGNIMGSMLSTGDVGETVTIEAEISDPTDSSIGKVEVIVNGGLSLSDAVKTINAATGTYKVTVPATYNYYYLRITQPDGDIAVTAPVWIGAVEAIGVSSFTAESQLTVAGEEQSFELTMFNNEKKAFNMTSVEVKYGGTDVYTNTEPGVLAKMSTVSFDFSYTFPTDGIITLTATVKGTLDGNEKTYTKDLELQVMPANVVSTIVVDGSHYNDYVTGYYGGNMNNAPTIAAQNGVKMVVDTDGITAADLVGCDLLVVSAPARKPGTANAGAYVASSFDDAFITVVADYVKAGGSVVVCGLADYQDKGANSADDHAAAQLNKLLTAVGSTMSINDDEAYDDVNNGGQAYRLYPETFNTASEWCAGIVTGQTYSQYSGCTVDPGSGTWLVKGFDSTYSIDSDNDGKGGVAKGDAVFMACEDTAYGGTIFVSGGVFLSDFEVKAELDNIWDLPYANRTIYENMLNAFCAPATITPIASVREAELGRLFAIEGYVTSGTTNPNTSFFDAIYVQDSSGGITVFPYAESGLAIGTKVRILGYTDAYQGDKEIQIINIKALDEEPYVYEPLALDPTEAGDYATYGGQLIKTTGRVENIVMANGVVSQFELVKGEGRVTVFIDGYISNEKGVNDVAQRIKEGDEISAVGLLYMHPEGDSEESVAVLRVRNTDEIGGEDEDYEITYAINIADAANGSVSASPRRAGLGKSVTLTVSPDEGYELKSLSVTDIGLKELELTANADGTYTFTMPIGSVKVSAQFAKIPTGEFPFTDVKESDWYYEAIEYVWSKNMVEGMDDESFAPNLKTNRAMVVTLLWRLEGEPAMDKASTFSDVADGTWYTDAVIWATENGIVNGYDNGKFGPLDNVTREQFAAMLYRYAEYKGYDLALADEDILAKFSDSAKISSYALEAMKWVCDSGIVDGMGDGTLAPTGFATRAQVAAMLMRFCENAAK